MFVRVIASAVLGVAVGCGAQPEPEPVKRDRPGPNAKEGKVVDTKATKAPKKPRKPSKEELAAQERTFEFQLGKAQKKVEGWKKTAQGNKTSLPLRSLAGAYMRLARLTGDYNDYKAAEETIEKAFATIQHPPPSVNRTRARLNFTLHRMDRIEEDLVKVRLDPTQNASGKAGDLSFEAKVAFQSGDYKRAEEMFAKSLAIEEGYSNLSSLAVFRWKTGKFDEAEELLGKALAGYRGKLMEPRAWVHLQLGLMDLDRGRYDEALVHYREGESFVTGYWLIDEHIAEILTLTGKTEEAKALYLDIIERTDNPEFMDSMAGILAAEGKEAESKAYVERARKRYEELLALYPEAAAGHALEHFLEFGEDTAQIVEMAERNHTLRPNGEAKGLLAAAYLKADRIKDASKTIKQALKTPWVSADLHATAVEIYLADGKQKLAEKQRELAIAINPKIELPQAEAPEG